MNIAVDYFVVLSLQYLGQSQWHYVYALAPGARPIREVSRYVMELTPQISVAFGFAVNYIFTTIAQLSNRTFSRALTIVFLAVVTLGLIEQFNTGADQYFSISTENRRLGRLAASLPADCSLFYVAAAGGVHLQDGFTSQNWMHDAMLVSVTTHVPTMNGRSGKNPPGWSLRDITAPDYEANVRQWLERNNVAGKVCRLELND